MRTTTAAQISGATLDVDAELARGVELLATRPAEALHIAEVVLTAFPQHSIATLLLGSAQRLLGHPEQAVETLEALVVAEPHAALAHYEYAQALSACGRGEQAVEAVRRALELKPALPGAWRTLGDHLVAMGDTAGADAAYAHHVQTVTHNPTLMRAAAALYKNEIPTAEAVLREHLRRHPTDVAAIRMLAEVAARIGRLIDAATLLERCLELAPGFSDARAQYAGVLNRRNRATEALAQVEHLLASDRCNPNYRILQASILVNLGEYPRAIDLYAALLAEYPHQPRTWLSYGHVLKTAGRTSEAVDAYRRGLALSPALGEGWWSLANLKTFRFAASDIQTMSRALTADRLAADDRVQLHFALGKACEDASEYAQSFAHYRDANRLRREQISYFPDGVTRLIERSCALYTPEFLRDRAGWGSPEAGPIFIVGLPRAGSTLVDQILSSHSLVEGTMELDDMIDVARSLEFRHGDPETACYPQPLASLDERAVRALGEQYLNRTRVYRKSDAPFFTDKMPNNFLHVGLIALALPRARIIDVRRHPLAACFAVFKQHFARGQHFSYDLEELGRYYRDYVALMAHFDTVLPGRVHRVYYEDLVEDTEREVRALLDYCGLAFEEQCLRFYENKRAVRTPSSEQVRQPIFRTALDQWRHFEPWLSPLKQALGPALEGYRGLESFTSDI